jgi:hypothetical protein
MRNVRRTITGRFDSVDSQSGIPATHRLKWRCRRMSVIGIVTLVGVAPLILAACGSSSAAPSTTSGSGASKSSKASATAYTACLKQHGVTLPSFPGGSGGPPAGGGTPPTFGSGGSVPGGGGFANNPKFQEAASACKSLRPSGGFGGFGGSGGVNSTAFAAYRNCLKLHGVTLPTGGASTGGAGSAPPSTIDQSSPTVKAALAACASLRPSASSSTTTTTG